MDVSNKLRLNADKTEVPVIGTRHSRATNDIPRSTINGVIVPVLNELFSNLGAGSDPNMNMSEHLQKLLYLQIITLKILEN